MTTRYDYACMVCGRTFRSVRANPGRPVAPVETIPSCCDRPQCRSGWRKLPGFHVTRPKRQDGRVEPWY